MKPPNLIENGDNSIDRDLMFDITTGKRLLIKQYRGRHFDDLYWLMVDSGFNKSLNPILDYIDHISSLAEILEKEV